MADRREGGEWVMTAGYSDEDGVVTARLHLRIPEDAPVPDVELGGVLTFPSLALYQDFRAFWKGAGGVLEEE